MNEQPGPGAAAGRSPEGAGERPRPFPLGRLFATPGAIEACGRAVTTPLEYINRHARGDWGDMGPEDLAANNDALECEVQVYLSYFL